MYSFIKHILIGYGIGSLTYHIYSFCRFWNFKRQLNKTLSKIKEAFKQPDELNNEFNKRRYELAYNNKIERVKTKIEELKDSEMCKQIANQLACMIMVDVAETMVEKERAEGKIDNLYSDNNL